MHPAGALALGFLGAGGMSIRVMCGRCDELAPSAVMRCFLGLSRDMAW